MGLFSAIKLVVILAIIMILAGGIYYVTDLKAALATSEANSAKLQDAVQEQQAVIQQQKEEFEKIQIINKDLAAQNVKLQKDVSDLNTKFDQSANGESRDFGEIARAKPLAVEKAINKATDAVNRCFEIATGAELKEGETNSECQELINSINSSK